MTVDGTDRLILDEAALGEAPLRIAVLDDVSGGLAVAAAQRFAGAEVRLRCDSLLAERAAQEQIVASRLEGRIAVHTELSAAINGVDLVLLRLPKSLAALEEISEAVATLAAAGVWIFAGGRVGHMTHGMNAVLGQHFRTVTASLSREKSRVLRATEARIGVKITFPRSRRHNDLDLEVWGHGAAFAGQNVDLGTRSLLACFARMPPTATKIIDLGCGTGILSARAARTWPLASVLAIDESQAACDSAARTAKANGLAGQVTVRRADGLTEEPDESADLILCNPPFHVGTRKDSTPAIGMFAEAGRVLTPGGELWTVFNSHLPYRLALRRLVGQTDIVAQNPKFSVARSRRS